MPYNPNIPRHLQDKERQRVQGTATTLLNRETIQLFGSPRETALEPTIILLEAMSDQSGLQPVDVLRYFEDKPNARLQYRSISTWETALAYTEARLKGHREELGNLADEEVLDQLAVLLTTFTYMPWIPLEPPDEAVEAIPGALGELSDWLTEANWPTLVGLTATSLMVMSERRQPEAADFEAVFEASQVELLALMFHSLHYRGAFQSESNHLS